MTISYNEDFNYAAQKLPGSIISYKGSPVMVNHVCPVEGRVEAVIVGTARNIEAPLAEFDLEPIKLGYVNKTRDCVYTMRIPARHWRQGIRNNTLHVRGGRLNLNSRYLINCVRGIYPSMEDCIEAIETGECTERAFSRRFKVGGREAAGYTIYLKDRLVAYATRGILGYNFNYVPGKEFAREDLEQVVNV